MAGHNRQLKPARLGVSLILMLNDTFELRAKSAVPTPRSAGSAERAEARDAPMNAPRRGFAAGMTSGAIEVDSAGHAACVQVILAPWAARQVLGASPHALRDQVVPLDALGAAALTELEDAVASSASGPARFALVQRFLHARLAADDRPATLQRALGEIHRQHGDLRIDALCRLLGCSRKHLAVLFHEQLGAPPRFVRRLERFTRALEFARAAPNPRWSDVAAACGYADQPHLSREFLGFAGETPRQWQSRLRAPLGAMPA